MTCARALSFASAARLPSSQARCGRQPRAGDSEVETSGALLHRRSSSPSGRVRRVCAESRGRGELGAAGFLSTVAGTLLVRSSCAVPGLDLYPAGALSAAMGWMLLTSAWWRAAKGPAFVPALFVLSIVIGLVAQIVSRASLFVASGAIFGAAVAGAGRQVILGVTPLPDIKT